MTISIIIPTYNEAENIGNLCAHLTKIKTPAVVEIIVVDGGSQDDTLEITGNYDVVVLQSPEKGRSKQMNHAAAKAKGAILHFVHADTLPPQGCFDAVLKAVAAGFPTGRFTSKFDSSSMMLKINAYFTRFDRLWCKGGDQAIFITKAVFEQLNGYRSDYQIMEEYDFLIRAEKADIPFKIIQQPVLISARKYEGRSWLRVQIANLIVFNLFRRGASQERLVNTYKRLLG